MSIRTCPHCGSTNNQVKAGTNHGNQRYKCSACRRRYTPDIRTRGYSEDLRRQAVQMHAHGMTLREIGSQLTVSPRTIVNWIRHAAASGDGEPGLGDQPVEQGTDGLAHPNGANGRARAGRASKRRANIRDVAERAGVSTSTISNYLNDKGRMSAETRDRITAAMEALHFTPSALVRAIRQRRTRIIGVVIFGLVSLDEGVGFSITPPILRGINDGADAAEHDLLIYTGWPERTRRFTGLNFLDGHVDGLIWVGPDLHEPAMERAAAAGLPVVGLLTRHVPDGAGYVNADNVAAMHDLVGHLRTTGRRRIGYVAPVHSSNHIDRLDGYRQALAACEIERDLALEAVLSSDIWAPQSYRRVLDRWLALPEPPNAIMAADDGRAARLVEDIRALGLRVPEDIAVTGFDDVPDAVRAAGGLTTVRQPFRQIGRTGVEVLLEMIDGAPAEECRVTLPASLIVRASTLGEI